MNPEWLTEIMDISQSSGVIKLYSVEDIELKYTPLVEENIQKRNLDIQVFNSIISKFSIRVTHFLVM